ncbi:MAG: cation:proton antiporter [Paraglaciecola sp.]|nr:cation:proton antiporter [Paraglaciecola sp.]
MYYLTDFLNLFVGIPQTLMLFTIGLKLNVRDLYKPEVWLASTAHMLFWVGITTVLLIALAWLGLGVLGLMSWTNLALLTFCLSFSSTVCVVKILEDNGELKTRHGKIAVGVLVMQDILAVLFLVIATGKTPTLWALLLPGLLFLKPLWQRCLAQVGHGELLPLAGFLFAIGGYEVFELVGIKGDLGALVVGMLIAPHFKAAELSKALLSFKDLFLIGFFLNIGLTALPSWSLLLAALGLCLLIPLKFILFFRLFTWLKLRARTAYLSSLVLSNYSEFGLIVVALLVNLGLLTADWLVVLALALSFSFMFTSLVYKTSHHQYQQHGALLKSFESQDRLSADTYFQPANAEILVVGLGRVGKGAYHALHNLQGDKVWGMDADPARVNKLRKTGVQAMMGDGEDSDFWENMDMSKIQLVLLALPSIQDICTITQQLKHANYQGKIASIARYEDEVNALLAAGSDKVFNFFTEAGSGFAEESMLLLQPVTPHD